jgi:hypothetical protein
MTEGLSKAEHELVEAVERSTYLLLITLNRSINQLVREIQRNGDATTQRPYALAVQAGLAADVAEKMAEAQAFLADLVQKLAVLQDEQAKKL